ncbi:MAG: 2,3-bisphosphoglycerate-dependent phosphoglycerate mutase [Patescibacteria group bacterium]|nr:2,3-bisphosphoglycerate-dependent phosphoglycerate mutase [Patescibacteria group bacterium]
MAYLALIRHGQSVLNAQNKECGWIDSPLTQLGRQEARDAAQKIKDKKWDYIFESDLIRSHETTDEIIKVLGYSPIRVASPAIKERNYGIYANHDKSEVSHDIRRGWDVPVPQGETLKQVYDRVVPYFQAEILPKLEDGKDVIISAHGNSLRALYKYLKNLSDREIENFEVPTGDCILLPFPPDPSPQI